ncbi:small ubiquitin-related modifier 3-like [Rhopalosiphum padi]|uniref:small ubiquitin-related modifier 3-like n=1 Tax=Rhopalosiphum padi TaxID=40932 RepID=UPI00298D75FA|nr:small ubiquitin-related modifier 3-like [Rhopalosiphum padi]
MDIAERNAHEYVGIWVHGFDNSFVKFKIRRHTPLRILMETYCQMHRLDKARVRFLFDGRIIVDADTLSSLEIEENDTIEVFREQTSEPRHYFLLYYSI